MNSRCDRLTLRNFGQQLFPDSPRLLLRSMDWVEKNVEGFLKYLFLDLSPSTHLPSQYKYRELLIIYLFYNDRSLVLQPVLLVLFPIFVLVFCSKHDCEN